jgi:hypothetical protein
MSSGGGNAKPKNRRVHLCQEASGVRRDIPGDAGTPQRTRKAEMIGESRSGAGNAIGERESIVPPECGWVDVSS